MTREEAIRLIGWLKCTTNREDDLEAIDMAIEALSADAVHGEWHKTENEEMEITGYYCSVFDMPTDEPTNYCGNCGADMRGNK